MPGIFAKVWPAAFDLAIQNGHFKGRQSLRQVYMLVAIFLALPPLLTLKNMKNQL
jgi:hypothetical protein